MFLCTLIICKDASALQIFRKQIRIWIQIRKVLISNSGSGSVPKCFGSGTLLFTLPLSWQFNNYFTSTTDDNMKMSGLDLASLAATFPDLTPEERQLLADIRRSDFTTIFKNYFIEVQ
jgi:hypothetical protein